MRSLVPSWAGVVTTRSTARISTTDLRDLEEKEDEIWGLASDDELYGGPGRDAMLGGARDDFLESKDGERDYVDCGPGEDVASVDMQDRVSRTCETIYAA
jgi:Ca2+-binding RTX toxin-like protein